MESESEIGLALFLRILRNLERLDIPYVVIGGFAATLYGITRATFDIDIVVELNESDMQALSDTFPLPRYYTDPYQLKQATELGGNFNIIDTERGEKADLFPTSMDPRYQPVLENRVRQMVTIPNVEPFEIWAARREDVIFGKLMALAELSTERHENDIFEILVQNYLRTAQESTYEIDELYLDEQAAILGPDTYQRWRRIRDAARSDADDQLGGSPEHLTK